MLKQVIKRKASVNSVCNHLHSCINKLIVSSAFVAMLLINATANAQQNTSRNILTMGDSITAGLAGNRSGVIRCAALGGIIVAANNQRSCRGGGRQNVGGWPPILRNLTGSNTFNFGNSGETTAEMVARFQASLAARSSRYVLILGGTNDVILNRPRAQTIANIQRMITATRAANRIPIVGTIPPLLLGQFASINPRVVALNTAIKAIENVEIADHYALLVANWGANNSGDTIHLGTLGNEIVARSWFNAIERVNQPEPEPEPITISPVINLLITD